jgi:hypothetical protein
VYIVIWEGTLFKVSIIVVGVSCIVDYNNCVFAVDCWLVV